MFKRWYNPSKRRIECGLIINPLTKNNRYQILTIFGIMYLPKEFLKN